MVTLKSYLSGSWQVGTGTDTILINPSTEEPVASSNTKGLDFQDALVFAREKGGPALRAMSFAERADLLKSMSRALYEQRERRLDISRDCNWATRGDAKFDVDGATATLSSSTVPTLSVRSTLPALTTTLTSSTLPTLATLWFPELLPTLNQHCPRV